MQNTLSVFSAAKEQLRGYLVNYLEGQGRHVVPGKNFRCINPAHEDVDPSCGIVPESNGQCFHCFGCGAVGDIFTAAHFIEGRQLSGAGFVHDNLKRLAEQFGVELPLEQPTPEEQYEMDTYRAYRDAAQIVLMSKFSDRVDAKLTEYGWSKQTRMSLGVGSVTSYENFVERMITHHGWTKEFLREIDLHRKSMFNEDNLIFTVRDENGNPVGFACRNLLYEEQFKEYENQRNGIIVTMPEDSPERTKALESLKKPSKYINSMERSVGEETALRNWIYQKSKRLFGLHRAKKYTPPLYIFEGYSDCVTAVDKGVHNSTAIGSTSFTKDHLELILGLNIKHLIFVLDADDAGEEGTDRFVKLVEENIGGHIGLRVEIIAMPPGTDDPDAFIRSGGIKAFRALPRTDIFGWSLKRSIKEGKDPETLAKSMVQLIVNDQSNFVRLRKAKQLAEATNIPEDVIWREITRLVDSELAQIEEEKTSLSNRIAKKLQSHPGALETIIKEAQDQVDSIVSRRQGYNSANTKHYIDQIKDAQSQDTHTVELKTGWPLFDKWIGGIPKAEAFVTVPGKMNQGKSSFLANLAWRLLDNNSDVMVLYHTIDDSMPVFLPRVWASKYDTRHLEGDKLIHDHFDPKLAIGTTDDGFRDGWYSNDWKKAGWHLSNTNGFSEIYGQSMTWIDHMVESERFVPEDISTLANSLPALEMRIKALHQKFPERSLVVIGDNFHLYDLPGYNDGESKITHMSMFVKGLANKYHCTIIMTMELPKSSLSPGIRPRVRNIKGSAGMSYDSSLNIGVYNDQKDYGENAVLFHPFDGLKDPSTAQPGYKKPVLELVFDKSKINSFDGVIYYGFEPRSGNMFEYPLDGTYKFNQAYFRGKAVSQKSASEQIEHSKAENNSPF